MSPEENVGCGWRRVVVSCVLGTSPNEGAGQKVWIVPICVLCKKVSLDP